uniref:cAMP-dependent protein kinase type II regulatory subunit n=1 Tax=Lygus hesperus TaxID=30085 RepID=A0A0A9W0Z7_LYGHE
MEQVRSKVILVSDFKCCRKYRHTLPWHVELVGGDDSDATVGAFQFHKSMTEITEVLRPASTQGHSGGDLSSSRGFSDIDLLETTDENLEDEILEVEGEMLGEESEDDVTVCSDWIVFKPRKKKKTKPQEILVTDVKEPSEPEDEVFVSKVTTETIPSAFWKYKDFCKDLPKTPPLKDEALRKRAPSPNSSTPRSDVGMYETKGEDWIWFEGRYLEGGAWEVAAGEDGEYYRMQKQWKEGHWEPAKWLVEKWEKEELELEKERLKELEEKRKQQEILKRADSPGVDIINWSSGPLKLSSCESNKSLKSKNASEMSLQHMRKTVEVEIPCDVIPEDFRDLLLEFARQFVDKLPSDPLDYAVTYFEERLPYMDEVEEEKGEDASELSLFQFSKRRKSLAEPSAYSIDLSDTEKTEAQVEIIIKALHDCWLLKDLDIACYISLVREMYRMTVSARASVRTLEDEADHMYVIESGTYQLSNSLKTVVLKDRGSFGDVSLVGLYNIKFPYDVVALTDGALWCLHKHSFINAKRKMNIHRERLMSEMMMGIELFDNLYEEEFYKLIHCVEIMYFQKGDVLFCEQTKSEGIYFFLFGEVKLIKMDEKIMKTKRGKTKTVKRLKTIGTFSSPHAVGHENLMYGDVWEYSCVARSHILEVALLKIDVLERLVGDVDDIMNRPINEIMTLHEKAKVLRLPGEEDVCEEELDEIEVKGEDEGESAFEEMTPKPTMGRLSIKKPDIDDMI